MRGKRARLAAALVIAVGTMGVAAGCGDDNGGSGNLGLIKEGTLTIGLDTPYEPFDIGHPPDATGYDVEVMNAIADDMGLTPFYDETGFATIFRDTANGQFDTAAAASDITEEREREVDFTDPYYLSSTALIAASDSGIASVDDLSGKIVGVQDGTTQQDYAEDETDAAEVRGFPEGPNAVAALVTGQVDAVLLDLATAAGAVESEEGLEVVEEIPTTVFFGFAVAPENDALREAMNDSIANIKDDGTINDLYQKYFGVDAPDEVLNGTNELLTDDKSS